MPTLMAIAPNGAIAVSTDQPLPRNLPPGHHHHPESSIHLWAGRASVHASTHITNMTVYERQQGWQPPNPEELARLFHPARSLTLEANDTPLSLATAEAPVPDGYLLAIAAATVLLTNVTNGTSTATFPDGSQAYLFAPTLEVRPAD